MLKNQTVNHVSEHLSAICPVYTQQGEGLRTTVAEGDELAPYGWALSPAVVLPSHPFVLLALTFEMENVKESDCQPCVRTPVSDVSGLYTW